MRIRIGSMVLGLALAVSVWAAEDIEISTELRLALQADLEALQQDGPKMGEVMAALREIGASYLPELVAPADINHYQTMGRRRLISGVYLMDLTYAATFARRDAAATFGDALHQLLDQLGHPQPELERRYREALENIDDPGGDARLQQLVQEMNSDAWWQDKLQTGNGVQLVADSLYGFLIEGLYITSELCFLSDYNPASLMYVAYMRESFQGYKRLLNRLGSSPEFAASFDMHDRLNFLASILVILGDLPEVGPAQIDSLRPAIAKARREIVR